MHITAITEAGTPKRANISHGTVCTIEGPKCVLGVDEAPD